MNLIASSAAAAAASPTPHPASATGLPPAADYCALPSSMFEGGHCGRCVRVCGADSCVIVSAAARNSAACC